MKRRTVIQGKPLTSSLLSAAVNRRQRKVPQGVSSAPVDPIFAMGEVEAPMLGLLAKSRVVGRSARQTEYLHVSDLLGKCVRKFALFETLKIAQKPQAISLTDALTYAQGDAIHDVLKARMVAAAPDRVWGRWRCVCGHTVVEEPCTYANVDQSVVCERCEFPTNVYVEVSMRDEEYKIVGNPDILISLHEHGALYVTELKSISHDQWRELVRPIPEHVLQVVFYWLLMRRKGYRLADKVSVVYATKGWMFSGNPCKEFVIDPQHELPRLDRYLRYASQMIAFRAGGELPEKVCTTPRDTMAKNCEVCTTCFEGNQNARPVEIPITQALSGSVRSRRVS